MRASFESANADQGRLSARPGIDPFVASVAPDRCFPGTVRPAVGSDPHASGRILLPAHLEETIMGDYDKGQDAGKPGQDDKPGFDKQQEQQGGKEDQGQDKGADFDKEDAGGKPDQQQ